MPADPAEELAELTRAAHGAVKDLRQALTAARAARAELVAEVNAGIAHIQHDMARYLAEQMKECEAGIGRAGRDLCDELNTVGQEAISHIMALAGVKDIQAFTDAVANQAACEMVRHLHDEVAEIVREEVRRHGR
jgi:hypothetical protein